MQWRERDTILRTPNLVESADDEPVILVLGLVPVVRHQWYVAGRIAHAVEMVVLRASAF